MLDLTFEQIRHYAAADLAVNLRLLRAMGDIAATTQRYDVHRALAARARILVERAAEHMVAVDAARLRQRLATLEKQLAV